MPIPLKVTLLLISLLSGALAQSPASIETRLSSRMLVVGEKTLLSVQVKNATVLDWPDSPNAAPLALTRERTNRINFNGSIQEVFEYSVTAFREGLYTIPPFKLRTRQGILTSKPLTLRVAPVSSLATKGITIKPDTVPYLTGIFVEKKSPYVGETQAVEAKLYVPNGLPHLLKLYDGQVIKMEKDGIAAWRFTAERRPTGVLNYDGLKFVVYSYQSSINALREGDLSIGPGKVEPVFQMRVPVRGGFANVAKAFPIEFPAAPIKVRPLPGGAPLGFAGAVGNFTLTASTTTRELKLGDTITVEAQVTGRGNIDQFPGPFLVDPDEDWKQFDMISKPPGSERRSSSGTVEFSQVVRPMKNLPALPPYRFVFFDPVLEKYRTLETPTQALTMTGEALVANKSADTGLPFLSPSGQGLKTFGSKSGIPIWLWQIIPAAVLLLILSFALRNRLKRVRLSSQPSREFQAALDTLRAKSTNQIEFYREAARFVTEWRGQEGFEEIFKARDEICFQLNPPSEPVPEPERNRILKQLKSLSPILLTGLFLFLQFSPAAALDKDPELARAEILREMEANPSPEHFHNLALCEKALERPAKAALWAYRYEAQGGDASEILKSLPGIKAVERKGTDWLSIWPLSFYQQLTAAGGWALAILLAILRFQTLKGKRLLATICGIICPLGLLIGAAAWYLYPEEISFEPLHELSVTTEKVTPLQSQPYLGGSVIRENIAGSLCKITAERAGWVHLKLPGGITGWTQKTFVETVREEPDSSKVLK